MMGLSYLCPAPAGTLADGRRAGRRWPCFLLAPSSASLFSPPSCPCYAPSEQLRQLLTASMPAPGLHGALWQPAHRFYAGDAGSRPATAIWWLLVLAGLLAGLVSIPNCARMARFSLLPYH